jgi:hypothetical protein
MPVGGGSGIDCTGIGTAGSSGSTLFLRTRQTEPPIVNASKTPYSDLLTRRSAYPPPTPPVQVAEAPWSKTKASNAEERVQDLRIVFDPLPSRRVDVVASGSAHGRCCVAKQEEEHATPCDNVQTV